MTVPSFQLLGMTTVNWASSSVLVLKSSVRDMMSLLLLSNRPEDGPFVICGIMDPADIHMEWRPCSIARCVRFAGVTTLSVADPVFVSASVASSTTPVALADAACLMLANAVAALATSDKLFDASRSPEPAPSEPLGTKVNPILSPSEMVPTVKI